MVDFVFARHPVCDILAHAGFASAAADGLSALRFIGDELI